MNEIRRQNLIRLIKDVGSQSKLSKLIDLDAGYISQMKNGTRPITEKSARKIELSSGKNIGWFDIKCTNNKHKLVKNKESLYAVKTNKKLPIITFSDAWEIKEKGLIALDVTDSTIECYKINSECYGVYVNDSSMTGMIDSQYSFPVGRLVALNPLDVTPVIDKFYLFKLNDERVLFKQYKEADGNGYLHSLNPHHPPIFSDYEILAKAYRVIEDI